MDHRQEADAHAARATEILKTVDGILEGAVDPDRRSATITTLSAVARSHTALAMYHAGRMGDVLLGDAIDGGARTPMSLDAAREAGII